MRRLPLFALSGVLLSIPALPTLGQSPKLPNISERTFTGGSATVKVTGAFTIDADVPINTAASIGDGEMTWLQYGDSGSSSPNALVTRGEFGLGIQVAVGKDTAIAEGENCTGTLQVTATSVSGAWTCKGVTSYNPGSGGMSKVDIEIRFTADS